jgi:hypothetical protein
MSDPNATTKQTAGAQRAMGLAQLVNKVFAGDRVKASAAEHPGYRLEMVGPGVPSTSELTKVEDRLELIPVEAKDGEPRILIGTADPGMSNAELYGFERLRAARAKAGGGELPLDRSDYERLVAKVAAFFDRQGVPVTLHEVALVSAAPKAPAGRGRPIVLLGVAAVVLVALLAFALARR